jgi:hypothetical protein
MHYLMGEQKKWFSADFANNADKKHNNILEK